MIKTINATGKTFLALAGFLLFARPAAAYLDPGSGSFMFQILIGALLGGLVTIKVYFGKIKAFLVKLFKKEKVEKNDGR